MNRQTMKFGAILCVVAMVSFSMWPFWQWLTVKSASAAVQERTRLAAQNRAELKAAWDIAMQDGVLTTDESKVILDAAGEKSDSK